MFVCVCAGGGWGGGAWAGINFCDFLFTSLGIVFLCVCSGGGGGGGGGREKTGDQFL